MFTWVKRTKRVFDSKPIAAHLFVTEKCNLSCRYCTESNNKIPHPDLETVKCWIDKLHELGVIRIGIQGGEPLLHPDIIDIIRYIDQKGMGSSMSTNARLMTPELVADLHEAGLGSIHVSIDRMTPNDETEKCVTLVKSQLEQLKDSTIPLHLTAVLYGGSLEELPEVFEYAYTLGASMKAHLVHAGIDDTFTIEPGKNEPLLSFIDWEIDQKKRGRNIRSSFNVLAYQKSLLNDTSYSWTCLAGYKYLFVSAQGEFWLCSMKRRPGIHITEVTPEILRSNNQKKPCQKTCGMYCVVSESLANNNPLGFIGKEIAGYISGFFKRLSPAGTTRDL